MPFYIWRTGLVFRPFSRRYRRNPRRSCLQYGHDRLSEVLTDPSYARPDCCDDAYPLIGNYGVNDKDVESNDVHVKGFVVKEFCRHHSNYRATQSHRISQ